MSFLICSSLLFLGIDGNYLLDDVIFVFIIFSCKVLEVSHFLVHIISPFCIHTFQALYWYFYFFSQEFWDLLFWIYLRYASPERTFSRLIPESVIAHCTSFQNLLSITYSFLIRSNLSTLVSHCQHLQFGCPSLLLYLIIKGLRHISTPIFF